MNKPKKKQKEYRVVFKEELLMQLVFSLQCRSAGMFFRHGWEEISASPDVTRLCEKARRLIALDKANGFNSVLLTDENIFLEEQDKK